VEYDGKNLPEDAGNPYCEKHHCFINDVEEFMYCDDYREEPSFWTNPPIMEFDGYLFWTWDSIPRTWKGKPRNDPKYDKDAAPNAAQLEAVKNAMALEEHETRLDGGLVTDGKVAEPPVKSLMDKYDMTEDEARDVHETQTNIFSSILNDVLKEKREGGETPCKCGHAVDDHEPEDDLPGGSCNYIGCDCEIYEERDD
jgi:hypothetical protein